MTSAAKSDFAASEGKIILGASHHHFNRSKVEAIMSVTDTEAPVSASLVRNKSAVLLTQYVNLCN